MGAVLLPVPPVLTLYQTKLLPDAAVAVNAAAASPLQYEMAVVLLVGIAGAEQSTRMNTFSVTENFSTDAVSETVMVMLFLPVKPTA